MIMRGSSIPKAEYELKALYVLLMVHIIDCAISFSITSQALEQSHSCSNASKVTLTYKHYGDVIMGAIASQITSLAVVSSTVYSDADQRRHQSSVSLAFVRGIHRWPGNSPHRWPVTRKMFPFDDMRYMYMHHINLRHHTPNPPRRKI